MGHLSKAHGQSFQMSDWSLEVYMNNILIKTKAVEQLFDDLEKTLFTIQITY